MRFLLSSPRSLTSTAKSTSISMSVSVSPSASASPSSSRAEVIGGDLKDRVETGRSIGSAILGIGIDIVIEVDPETWEWSWVVSFMGGLDGDNEVPGRTSSVES